MSFVGLDIGGTYVKAAAFDHDGVPEFVLREPIAPFLDVSADAREIDPEALLAIVRRLLVGASDRMGRVSGIFVTGQMAGIAFVDDRGRAVAPLVSWQDTRVRDVETVAVRLGDDALSRTGDGLRVGLPLVTLSRLPRPADSFVTSLIAFVSGAVGGVRAATVHTTDAASWGLLDVAAGVWCDQALDAAGLESADMPAVASSVVPIGRSFVFDAPVFCAIGDQQAALLGAGLQPGEVSMNIATGGQVSVISAAGHSPAQLRPYFDGQYLHTITHLPSGRLLTAAVADAVGRVPGPLDWAWARDAVERGDSAAASVSNAVDEIASAFVDAARRLGTGKSASIRFSGGLAQKFTPLRNRIAAELDLPCSVFSGDDAALAGLGALSRQVVA